MKLAETKPKAVIDMDPTRWKKATTNAFVHLFSCSKVKISAEKEEKVVRPPSNPVMRNNFHKSEKFG